MEKPFEFTERLCREFVEKVSQLIFCVDMDDNLIYVNECWKAKLGYSEEETCRMTVWDIIHPDHIERCRQYLTLAKKGSAPDSAKETVKTIFISKLPKV